MVATLIQWLLCFPIKFQCFEKSELDILPANMLHIGSYRLNLPVAPNSESFWTQYLYNSQNSFGGKMKVFEYVEGPRPGETRGARQNPLKHLTFNLFQLQKQELNVLYVLQFILKNMHTLILFVKVQIKCLLGASCKIELKYFIRQTSYFFKISFFIFWTHFWGAHSCSTLSNTPLS